VADRRRRGRPRDEFRFSFRNGRHAQITAPCSSRARSIERRGRRTIIRRAKRNRNHCRRHRTRGEKGGRDAVTPCYVSRGLGTMGQKRPRPIGRTGWRLFRHSIGLSIDSSRRFYGRNEPIRWQAYIRFGRPVRMYIYIYMSASG